MEIFHSLSFSFSDAEGRANSNSAALPQAGTTQSGASRSVAPEMERRDFRCREERVRGSVKAYLSMKR